MFVVDFCGTSIFYVVSPFHGPQSNRSNLCWTRETMRIRKSNPIINIPPPLLPIFCHKILGLVPQLWCSLSRTRYLGHDPQIDRYIPTHVIHHHNNWPAIKTKPLLSWWWLSNWVVKVVIGGSESEQSTDLQQRKQHLSTAVKEKLQHIIPRKWQIQMQ